MFESSKTAASIAIIDALHRSEAMNDLELAAVASEVESLAMQTAKAADGIEAQIKAIQAASRTTAASIRQIGRIVASISEISASISSRAARETGEGSKEVLTVARALNDQAARLAQRRDDFVRAV